MAGDDFTLAPPPGPQCIDCGQPVQRRPGAAAPKRCPEHARERARELDRARYLTPEYRERERERQREFRRTPEYREYNRERQRERYAKVGRHNRNELVRLIVRQRALCALCGNLLPEDPADIHVDHVVPVARGGTNEPENLQAACAACNRRKGAGGNPQ